MPQWRKLPIRKTLDMDLNEMPDDLTRLLWVMLPLGLDREGRAMDNAAYIKSKVLPLREDVTLAQISDALNWYAAHGLIVRYTVKGRRYFYQRDFAEEQGDTHKETESEFPAPDLAESNAGPTPELVQTKSGPTPELVQTKSGADSDSDSDSDADADSDSDSDADAEAFLRSRWPATVSDHTGGDGGLGPGEEAEALPNDERIDPAGTRERGRDTRQVPAQVVGTLSFPEWLAVLRNPEPPDNRQAVLRRLFVALYPDHEAPDFGYIGRVATQVGGAERLAQLLWEQSTRPPVGDVLAFCLQVARRNRSNVVQFPGGRDEPAGYDALRRAAEEEGLSFGH